MKTRLRYLLSAFVLACVVAFGLTGIGRTAITELSGLAVAQTGTLWKNVKDASAGDNLVDGVLASALMMYDSASNNFDRLRGSITNGILVDVTRAPGSNQTPADGFANPTTFQGSWSLTGIFNATTWDRWRGQVSPVQGPTLFNSETVGVANTAIVITIAASAGQRAHVYQISRALCVPAGTSTLLMTDGGLQIWGAQAIGSLDTFSQVWPVGLTLTTNSAVVITMSTCGAGNQGVLGVQADRF